MTGATIRRVIAAAAMVRDNGQWSAEDFFARVSILLGLVRRQDRRPPLAPLTRR